MSKLKGVSLKNGKIRVGSRARSKPLRSRKKPYGSGTKQHYVVLPAFGQLPAGFCVISDYRVRHTYRSLWNWLVKALAARRFFDRKRAEKFCEETWAKASN